MAQEVGLKPYIGGCIFSLLVGFSFIGVKICVSVATPLETLTYRYDFAFLAAIIVMVFKKKAISFRAKPVFKLFVTGACYVLFMVFQTRGLVYSSSIESAVIFTLIPIFVLVLARVFLKEKTTVIQNISIIVCISVLIYMILQGTGKLSVDPLGTFLLLIASLCMAVNNVLMRNLKNDFTPFEIAVVSIVIGFVGFNIATILSKTIGTSTTSYLQPLTNGGFVIATVYLGIFCILVSTSLMSYMQGNISSANASLFGNVSTAISIVAGAIFLHEPLENYHIACTAIILLAVVVSNLPVNRRRNYEL